MRKLFFLLLLGIGSAVQSAAQNLSIASSQPAVGSDWTDTISSSDQLSLDVEAMAFFRDNEFDSPIQKGYTLPGLWIRPKLVFQTLKHIKLELGLHAMVLNGANKYPNYAYHDIATWKGNQYQRGAHVLPWFRAQVSLKHTSIVLGDIYGAHRHRLIQPLFNPEQTFSADPEMGLQVLVNRPHVQLDTWVNWQSYQFEQDSHQEAFTVGHSTKLLWGRQDKPLRWSTPIQLLIQHRGGEQDTTDMGVQTLCNAGAGVRMDWVPRRATWLSTLNAQVNILGSYQQSGTLWPFDFGMAGHAAVGARLWNRLDVEVGHFDAPRRYANLYGTPFMGTISLKTPGLRFHGQHNTYAQLAYTHTFNKAYRLGAGTEVMRTQYGNESSTVFSFGVYLHVSPSFLLKRWR